GHWASLAASDIWARRGTWSSTSPIGNAWCTRRSSTRSSANTWRRTSEARSASPPRRAYEPARSPPLSSIKRAIGSTPSPARRLLKTKGRAPRMRLASRSITASEAPTCGARSILLITRRSERVMPGPPLDGILSPAGPPVGGCGGAGGHGDSEERKARKPGREGRGDFAPPGLGEQERGRGIFLLHRGARREIDRRAPADRGGGATAGLDPRDTLWR